MLGLNLIIQYQLYKLPEPMGVLEHPKNPPGYATEQGVFTGITIVKDGDNGKPLH